MKTATTTLMNSTIRTLSILNLIIKSKSHNHQSNLNHFNSRSLNIHFKDYLHTISQAFIIIAISETWINSGNVADF